MGTDFRDPIAHALELQRQQQQRRPQQPFAPPMQPMRPQPMIGTPAPRPQEPAPYGSFQQGYNAAMGPSEPRDGGGGKGWKEMLAMLTGGGG